MSPDPENKKSHIGFETKYIELIEYFVEETKHVKSPLNIKQLAEDYNKKSRTSYSVVYLRESIVVIRLIIHKMDGIDTETKVKIIFGLSAPVDDDFFQQLKEEAVVILDDDRRIIKYERAGGDLRLEGAHPVDGVTNENDILMGRLILMLMNFKHESWYKAITESPLSIDYLTSRYNISKSEIYRPRALGERTMAQMLFVSGARLSNNVLNGLQKNALVEVDENNRIIRYEANDGSLKLGGDHYDSDSLELDSNNSRVIKNEKPQNKQGEADEFSSSKPTKTLPDDSMRSDEQDQSDEDEETEGSKKTSKTLKSTNGNQKTVEDDHAPNGLQQVATRSGRVSKKRILDIDSDLGGSDVHEALRSTKNQKISSAAPTSGKSDSTKKKRKTDTAGSNKSKRTKPNIDCPNPSNEQEEYHSKQQDNSNDKTDNSKKTSKTPKSTERKRESLPNTSEENKESAPTDSREPEDYAPEDVQHHRENSPNDHSMRTDEQDDQDQNRADSPFVELKPFRGSILDSELLNPVDEDVQILERPLPPASQDVQFPIKTEDPVIPNQVEVPPKVKDPVEEVKPKFTSKLKILKAIKSIVNTLNTPCLSQVKSKICQNIWKVGESHKTIQHDEMVTAMELLVIRIVNHSTASLPDNVEHVNLSNFLCYLKATILSLELEGLDSFVEKIEGRIKDPASNFKKIRGETVACALQTTIDVIGY